MRYFRRIVSLVRPSHMLTTAGSDSVFPLLGVHAIFPNVRSEDARAHHHSCLPSMTPHQHGLLHPSKSLSSAYCVRKALATGTIDTSKPFPTTLRERRGCREYEWSMAVGVQILRLCQLNIVSERWRAYARYWPMAQTND